MKEGGLLNEKFTVLPLIPDPEVLAEQSDYTLRQLFHKKIRGHFLIDIKNQVMKEMAPEIVTKYYNLRMTSIEMVTGINEAPTYDICSIITGIHRAHSIFLSKKEIRKNEISKEYRQQLVTETIEKIKLRLYGSVYFRKKSFIQEEEFLYYPLPYELFVISNKICDLLSGNPNISCLQLYYGVIYQGISALTLLGDNFWGTAYPLCRGAIEMYFKLLILINQTNFYENYEKFREFEVMQSCYHTYPNEFHILFEKRICQNQRQKSAYLHYGWVDEIDGYHKIAKQSPYSVSGIITFLKYKYTDKIPELNLLEWFYKSCHAYTHGSIQIAKYPVLHYFEISMMLYYIIRGTFFLLCKECKIEPAINGINMISVIDRDFKILKEQYDIRSTEKFDEYYHTNS